MPTSLIKIIQISLCLVLLVFVAWQTGLFEAQGRAAFWEMLKQADLALLALSIFVGVLINLSSSLKWWMLTQARNLGAGFWRIFCYYLIGQFYNLFLPTSVGGDVVRSYQLGKFSGRQADALASVFVERYTGVLVLLVFAFFAVVSQLAVFSNELVILSLGFFTVALAIIAWFIVDSRPYFVFRDWVVAQLPKSSAVFSKIDSLLDAIRVYDKHRGALAMAVVNSVIFYLLAVVNVYVTALVFSWDVSFLDMLIATPIIMLIMNLPISLGNFGLMEGGYVGLFALMGYEPALGLSVALLMRLKSLFDGAMGGLLQPMFIDADIRANSINRA